MATRRDRADHTPAPAGSAPQDPAQGLPEPASTFEERHDRPVARRFAMRAVLGAAAAALGATLFGATRPKPAEAVAGVFTASVAPNSAVTATATSGAYGVYTTSDTCDALYASSGATALPTAHFINTGGWDSVYSETTSSNASPNPVHSAVTGINHGTDPSVLGFSSNATGFGVLGIATNGGASSYGTWGQSLNGYGVVGGGGIGVFGNCNAGGTGVVGNASSGGYGVQGTSSGGSGANYGVYGAASRSTSSVGVLGISTTGTGFQGYTTAAAGTGASATNTAANGVALVGAASATSGAGIGAYCTCASIGGFGIGAYNTAGGYAGFFGGNVLVQGAFMVTGPKNAVVRDDAGSLRRMYSVESPESWFEDFGDGRLSNGRATVQLPADFAQLVKTDAYHVFLTPDGETEMLHVTGKTASTFQVKEGHGGTSSVGFSWRVIAKRRDIAGVRLERVEEPPTPNLPEALPIPDFASTPGAAPPPELPAVVPAPATPGWR
jgi:hypothetical protein